MTPHGGRRAGAGRKSLFRDKLKKPIAMKFTARARQQLDALARTHACSRNDIIERLVREDYAVIDPAFARAKLYPQVLSIRLTADTGAQLADRAARLGWSVAQLAEYLVLEYGPGLYRLSPGRPDGPILSTGPAAARRSQVNSGRSRRRSTARHTAPSPPRPRARRRVRKKD